VRLGATVTFDTCNETVAGGHSKTERKKERKDKRKEGRRKERERKKWISVC
jgi:hypothetical protein